jgi:hypothetical protein
MSDLDWLAGWYAAQCDGNWEQHAGVSIQSIDNPGWWVKIPLDGTDLAPRALDAMLDRVGTPPAVIEWKDGAPLRVEAAGEDWMICQIKGGRFDGAGDPTRLQAILQCFRHWATGTSGTAEGP